MRSDKVFKTLEMEFIDQLNRLEAQQINNN